MDSMELQQLAEELARTKQDDEVENMIEHAKAGTGELSDLNIRELDRFEKYHEATR